MRSIAIGLLGIVLVHGGAAAQTIEEQAQVLRDFEHQVASYTLQLTCLDPAHAAVATPPRIFTLPVAMVFRQLIAKALDEQGAATAVRGVGSAGSLHPPAVLEPFPADELFQFPQVLASALPALPGPLEYRLIGNDLVLRDARSDVVVGVLRDAVGTIATVKR